MSSLMIQHVILVALSLVVSIGSAAGSSSVQPQCHTDERHALLSFKTSFTILSSDCDFFYDNCARIPSWKSGIRDCCQWDGVTCDPLTGHVTELHLSHSLLNGSFPSNSTLFSLRHLRHIDLSYNNFRSPIPSGFGRLSDLIYLNLADSGFFGQVPQEIGWLSSLTTLDLSDNYELKMSVYKTVIANLTDLRELHLSFVLINTDLSPMIANLSKLTSLKLDGCNLQGEFLATSVLSLPSLRVLNLASNSELHADFSASIVKWTSPLEVVDLSGCNFTGKLPDSIGDSSNSSLISFSIMDCGFHGSIPGWMWNITEWIFLNGNKLSGTLPESISTTILGRLSFISLGGNSITGTIPAWLFTLPSLTYLSLGENLFTGIDHFTITNSSAPSVLYRFWADNNQLRGQIPEAIFELRNLDRLSLGGNNMNAIIPLSKLHSLQNLSELSLSHNNISFINDIGGESISSWPSFVILNLSSCNLDQFPIFLGDQKNLKILDLSKNAIHGHIPEWFLGNTISLQVLDISHNSLTGGLEHLQWKGQNMGYTISRSFFASNNQFSGGIPSFLCHLTDFAAVDISHNNLTGKIPGCFASLISSHTHVLDLSQNQLEGVIPSTIFEDCIMLRGFRLNGNRLEGPIPKSLSNCTSLQFIDLSKNNLNGTFPHWLGVLPNLEGLILGSNNLQGSLMGSNTTSSFPMLRILEFSNNDLTGGLPGGFLMSMKAMIEVDHRDQDPTSQYMDPYVFLYGQGHNFFFEESMNAWFKGFNRRLDKILKTLVLIDASRNRLEGSIPKAIGDLVSLRWLNLAHNNFTGHIPPSMGKLNLLESLDLSFNRLDGQIPNELVNLNSLAFFNVSENHLAGPVPTGKQFDTFSNDSYFGNPGLCGAALPKKCGKQVEVPNTVAHEGNNDESSGLDVWEIALMGFGFGMFVSSVWGYFILWEKEYLWVSRLILELQVFIMLHLMRRR